jgi:nuclear pore complex protein Nup93
LLENIQVDEDEDGGLRALTEVLLSYGERHFDGPPNQAGSRRSVWAGVLLMCGQFERVSIPHHCHLPMLYLSSPQAVAALLERQDTEIEAVHLAIALAYHGLLRVPSRAETSDVTPRKFTPKPPFLSAL